MASEFFDRLGIEGAITFPHGQMPQGPLGDRERLERMFVPVNDNFYLAFHVHLFANYRAARERVRFDYMRIKEGSSMESEMHHLDGGVNGSSRFWPSLRHGELSIDDCTTLMVMALIHAGLNDPTIANR